MKILNKRSCLKRMKDGNIKGGKKKQINLFEFYNNDEVRQIFITTG